MKEKTQAQQLAEKLFYKPAYAADKDVDVREKASAFAEGYKKYLDAAKTEREAAAESEKQLLAAGYQLFDPKRPMPQATRSILCRTTRQSWLPPSAPALLRTVSAC